MFFSQKILNKKKLSCICNNCENATFCLTDFVCYKAIGYKNCNANYEHCYGCFNNEVQRLQVIII